MIEFHVWKLTDSKSSLIQGPTKICFIGSYSTNTELLLIFLVIRISSTILVDCPQLVSEEWYKKNEGRLKQMKGLFSVFFSANTKAQ